jgi:predicted ester cyclase
MSSNDSKTVFLRILDEGFNQQRSEIADELVSADFIDHAAAPGFPTEGPESLKATMAMFHGAFPDVHATVDDVIAEGDRVVVRTHWHGTHLGDFFGIPPTGTEFDLTAIDILRVVDGKAVEHWGNEDDLGMLQQLGLITFPGSAGEDA